MVKVFSRFTFSLFCPAGVFPGNSCWCRRLGCWDESGRKIGAEDPCVQLGMGSERNQRAHCYRAGDDTGGIGSQEQWERCGWAFSLSVALVGMAFGSEILLTRKGNAVCRNFSV